ncbi:MAG: PhoH family protein [Bacteroidales bacterium]|nr:PhoH family protein [Bacteroidales bacterium]MBN2819026.1 PhoH family protein [Bacteroidales bacterium]
MAKKKKKIFVIDTNVLLHDFLSIYNFEENDIVIPITVLEELDKFKKGNDLINFHAREFTRELDKISGDNLFSGGVKLGEKLGKLSIETGKPFSAQIQASFPENTPDHRILAIAEYITLKNKDKSVTLVTKDINLRMKAKSIGVMSADYESDKVQNIDEFYKGISQVDNVDDNLITQVYEEVEGVPIDSVKLNILPKPNQYYILKGSRSSAIVYYNPFQHVFMRVLKQKIYGIDPRNAEQTFAVDSLMRDEIQLVTITGKAGTGKTLLALAAAIEQRQKYAQIFLARPIVPLSNRDIGFLPGDVKEKIGPYMQPLFDNLDVIKNKFKSTSKDYQKIEEMQKEEKLIITPLAYIRGRSLSNAFFIVDEAQNLTPHEIKTIITRAGEGTKMVFTGDIEQIDTPYLDLKSNGLSYLTDKMLGQDIFAHVNLVKGERSYLAELASNLL